MGFHFCSGIILLFWGGVCANVWHGICNHNFLFYVIHLYNYTNALQEIYLLIVLIFHGMASGRHRD